MITNLHTQKKHGGILNIDSVRTSLLHINLRITKNTDPRDFSIFIYSALIITDTHFPEEIKPAVKQPVAELLGLSR